ncbi:MAG: Gfo/Idh/MocA family oxidoreductase [Verrucomicrobiota bacterium]
MASMVRVAVLGVGSLGREHARVYAELAREGLVELAGLYDVQPAAAAVQAEKLGVPAFPSVEAALAAADAVSVVTPTVTHHALARQALEAGRHVLVEKPMTDSAAQAADLVERAGARDLVLQVGHIERFNPVFRYLEEACTQPRFIECHRLSPFPKRSTDIGVVLDLMIHDLDVILAFVKSPLAAVEAVGIPVLSASEDIANARLRFADGCVANLTASRISPERMRKIRVFSGGDRPSYVSLDYRAQEGFLYRLADEGAEASSLLHKLFHARDAAVVSEFAGRKILREPVPLAKEEPLRVELQHFVECVRARRTPRVTGQQAKDALDVAFEITRQIAPSLRRQP